MTMLPLLLLRKIMAILPTRSGVLPMLGVVGRYTGR